MWSLGVVLFECLTGTLPHEAANYNALMVRILTQDVDPVITRKVDLPANLCAIVDSCLKREREQRTPNAEMVASQMESVLRELRAVRFRAAGRRASDRVQGGFRRRASDFQPPPETTLTPAATATPALPRRLPRKRVMFLAAVIGVFIGLVAVVVGMVLMRR